MSREIRTRPKLDGGHDADRAPPGPEGGESLDDARRFLPDEVPADIGVEQVRREGAHGKSRRRRCGTCLGRRKEGQAPSARQNAELNVSGRSGERTRRSPSRRTESSVTSSSKRYSRGRRTAWLFPLLKTFAVAAMDHVYTCISGVATRTADRSTSIVYSSTACSPGARWASGFHAERRSGESLARRPTAPIP